MAWWDFKIFIAVLVSIVVVGFCIIPLIKTWCCIWPRVKPGEPISCTKKPCCWYFHFWKNESKSISIHFAHGIPSNLTPNVLNAHHTFSQILNLRFFLHFVLVVFLSVFFYKNRQLYRHFFHLF